MAQKKPAEVAKIPEQETAVALPFDYGEHAGVGLDLSIDDLKIPFIVLAQKDSKILDPEEESYVPGGEIGQLLNAATKEYTDELLLVPAVKRVTYVEWLPDRGGFVAEHLPTDPVVREARQNAVKRNEMRHPQTGNELQETRSLFCIIADQDLNPVGYCVVAFASSKIGSWREYFTLIDTAKATKSSPLYAHLIRLSSVDQKRKGKKFKNLSLLPARDEAGEFTTDKMKASVIGSMIAPDSALFQAAIQLRDAIDSGRAEADRDTVVDDSSSPSGDEHF